MGDDCLLDWSISSRSQRSDGITGSLISSVWIELFILARKEKRNENQDIFCSDGAHHHCIIAFWLFHFNQARSALEPND
jgi:hypothetical protein